MPIRYKATKRKDGTTRKLTLAERLVIALKPNTADRKRGRK